MTCLGLPDRAGRVVHLCVGPAPFTIYRGGSPTAPEPGRRTPPAVSFEMHSFCGPLPLSSAPHRKGMGIDLPVSHWFWTAVSQWAQQGQRVDEHRRCLYDPAVPLRELP